jgi:hypothetical protein
MKIDWQSLAKKLKCENRGGTGYAQQALSEILGDEAIIEAVEYYISGGIGSELARSVLWHIHPKAGIEHCYKIYRNENENIERRRFAVELLRVLADETALKWASEFLSDPDQEIQMWGAGLVDQLLWSHFIEEEDCKDILEIMKEHQNPEVKSRYEVIIQFLSEITNDREQNT